MKVKREEKSKVGRILLSGAVVFGWAIWRVIRGRPIFGGRAGNPPPTSAEKSQTPMTPSRSLRSLSKSTPGGAPLDRLARTASAEENFGMGLPPSVSAPAASTGTILAEQTILNNVDAVLAAQSLVSTRISGWNQPAPDRLPVPTFAPSIMAMGIVVFSMGIVTTWYVCAVGAMIFAVAAWRWVGELQGE